MVQSNISLNRAAAELVAVGMLLLLTPIARSSQATGLLIGIATADRSYNDLDPCGDVRHVVLTLHKNDTVKLNLEPEAEIPEIPPRLREIFKTRAYRVVFVRVDPDVSFHQFLRLTEAVRPEVQAVSILTDEVSSRIRVVGLKESGPAYCLGAGIPTDWLLSSPARNRDSAR